MGEKIRKPSAKALKKRENYIELIAKTKHKGIQCPKCGCKYFSVYRIKVNTMLCCCNCLSYIKFVSKEDLSKIIEEYTSVRQKAVQKSHEK